MTSASTSHGRSADDACSVQWDSADDETAWGTAALATFWVALEQNGPWGHSAATQSRLPTEVGSRLEQACAARGGRLTLVRTPADHPEHDAARRVVLAWTGTAAAPAFLLTAKVEGLDPLDGLDLDALARGDRPAVLASLPGLEPAAPLVLVCTNGRRDVCCAVRGRPVAIAGHLAHPGRVWECSHTGGHRFAPTGVLLPWGRTLARLDAAGVEAALTAADHGRLAPSLLGARHDRGTSALSPQEQVAESAVRALVGETAPLPLPTRVLPDAEATSGAEATVVVTHPDGRRWRVDLGLVTGPDRSASCGAQALPSRTWTAEVTATLAP